jgi:histidine triad (HIT) family protein
MHLIPINSADDLNFTRRKISITKEELLESQQAILQNMSEE